MEAACGRVETTARPDVDLGQDRTWKKVYSLGPVSELMQLNNIALGGKS